MKRLVGFCLAMVVTVGILVACGGNAEESTNEKEQPGENKKVVTLNFFNPKVEIGDELQALLKEFEAEHPHIKFNLETLGGGADVDAALKAKFASGHPPDIFNNGGFKQLELWKEHLADLSDEPWVDHLLPIGKVPMTDQDGKLYGMPFNLEGYGFIYNKDLFEEAGISEAPKTLSELIAAAEKLQQHGIIPFAAGYGEWWVVGIHLLNIPFAQQDDPDAFIAGLMNGTETFVGNPHFENFKQVIDTEIKYGNQNPLTTDYNTQVTLFASGQAAMLQQGNWTENMIYQIDPEMNMAFLPIPLDDAADADRLPVGVPNNWVINKNSPHVEEAKLFLNWMVSSETGKRYITEEFAFIPAFDNIEPSGLGALGESILEYSIADKTIPWTWFQWLDGANQDFGAAIQEYTAGQIDYTTMLERLQRAWDSRK